MVIIIPVANGHYPGYSSITTQLVLGSMYRADEYQQVLTSLKESAGSDGKVQGEMIDRLLDNGESTVWQIRIVRTFGADRWIMLKLIHVMLSATGLPAPPLTIHLVLPLPLPDQLLPAIPPSTQIFIHLSPSSSDEQTASLHLSLSQRNFVPLHPTPSTSIVAYTSPSVTSLPFAQPVRPLALPRRSTNRAAKAALWAIDSPLLPDGGKSLLTPEDRARPECIFPSSEGKPVKRRRACKDCTCGLADLEAQEEAQSAAAVREAQRSFFLEGDDDIPEALKKATSGTEGVWPVEKRAEAKKTSSCNSCGLGDAFRCSSCPYIGKSAQ